jgi:hypothetical protein
MKAKYKFEIKQHVFVLGRPGRCVVTGRGVMSFVSGGTVNMYQVCGGQQGILQESELLSVAEASKAYGAELSDIQQRR